MPQPGNVNPVAPGVGAAAAGAAAAGAAAAPTAPAPAPAVPGVPGAPPAAGIAPAPVPTPSPGLGGPSTASPMGQPAAATAAAAAARTAAASSNSPPLSAYANGSTGQDTHESAAARPEPLLVDDDRGGLSTGRVAMFIGSGIAVVLVAVVLMVVLTGGDDTQTPNDFGNTPAQETEAPAATPSGADPEAGSAGLTAAERRATKVAVLNGTTQSGLARNVGDKIEKARFTIESVGNNADQQIPTTIVSYTAGNDAAARAVAKLVGVDTAGVQPADANAAAAADADVIVTVGLDQSG